MKAERLFIGDREYVLYPDATDRGPPGPGERPGVDAVLAAVEASGLATALRFSRGWGYAAVNTAHVLGVALLVGAAVPLALRLLGLWRGVPLAGRRRDPVADGPPPA